jgi:hypothetical protein
MASSIAFKSKVSGAIGVPTLYIAVKTSPQGVKYTNMPRMPVYVVVPRVRKAFDFYRIYPAPLVPSLVNRIIIVRKPHTPILPYPPALPEAFREIPDLPKLTAEMFAVHYRMNLIPDKYLKSFDVYTPHFLLFSGTKDWRPDKWSAFVLPSRLVYHKDVVNERLATQMSGFYSLYASIFKYEPDLNLLSLAGKEEGVYIRQYGKRVVRIEVSPSGWRTSNLPLLSLNLRRVDKAEPSLYYQWLYVRELIALYFVDIVEHVIRMSTENNTIRRRVAHIARDCIKYLSDIVNISQMLPIDNKHIFHLLTSVSDGRARASLIEVPVPYNDVRFLDTETSTDVSGIIRVYWRTPIELDVYRPYSGGYTLLPVFGSGVDRLGVPAIILRKDIRILSTTVARLPQRVDYRITKPSIYGSITHLPFLLYLASNKPYIVSLMALYILHRQLGGDESVWTAKTLALELLRACESRVILYDLDIYAANSLADPVLREPVALHTAVDLYAGIRGAPSSLLSEYVQSHLTSLHEIRTAFRRGASRIAHDMPRKEETERVNERVYFLDEGERSKDPAKRHLFARRKRALNRFGERSGEKDLSPVELLLAEKTGNVYDTRTLSVSVVEYTHVIDEAKQLRIFYCPLIPDL